MEAEPAAERRVHPRVRGPFDATRLGLLEFKLRLYDLSVGGCFVDSPTQVATGRPIQLRIALPDGNAVTVRGVVTPPERDIGYGVRFIDLDDSTRYAIERALDYVQQERSQN
jgi:hypothetical protein